MKQSFDIKGGPSRGQHALPILRRFLAAQGLDGFHVPHEDEYQNEYLPAANERLAWATGFTGSAGAALIFTDRAVVFVDGRYTLQAADQLDPALFEIAGLPEPGPAGWLGMQALADQTIGYDPRLVSPDEASALARAAEKAGAVLEPVAENPLDQAWGAERPPQPRAKVVAHEFEYAGEASADKRARLGAMLVEQGADAAVITAPASLAWLFNIRGGDVACTPLPLGRAMLRADGSATLYLDEAKTSEELREHLGNGATLEPLDALPAALDALAGSRVSLDPALASVWFFERLHGAGVTILRAPDPCALPRACKNAVEIAGTRRAHQRDGAALTRFLHWLDTEAQSGAVTEIEAVQRLEALREETGKLRDRSFETISGAGPNGAVVHYRVTTATNRPLGRGSLFLVDSGGQYLDGTTDVTRTIPIGKPTPEMCDRYTRVLKGHIALSLVRFPAGTTGTHLDVLARHALWQAGLDYGHGTGHGVGAYLGVHEGPHRISRHWNAIALMPGMIVSNEPGYYKTGDYGIRIENLQVVTPPATIPGGEIDMLGFETLTLAPLARALIDLTLLTPMECAWIDTYHERVRDELGPRLHGADREWLEAATVSLASAAP